MDIQTQNTKHEDELSIGSYIGKQIYQESMSIGSLIAGGYAGLMAGKAASKVSETNPATFYEILPNAVKKIPGFGTPISNNAMKYGGITGIIGGTIAATTILGYEHWQKVKREQLQVDELTKNLSDLEVFKKSDPELLAENKRLWAELNARDAAASKTHAHTREPSSDQWTDRIKTTSEAQAEHVR